MTEKGAYSLFSPILFFVIHRMGNFGVYRGDFRDLMWNLPGRIVTVNYESGRGWRYTRAMHETKWEDPANPGQILANHVLVMSCPYSLETRITPELWVCPKCKTLGH